PGRGMQKKVVLVLTVLLTSAAVVSLILATSRYVGILKHPETWRRGTVFQVEPRRQEVGGLEVSVVPVLETAEGVSPLLVSTFWIFEVAVANGASGPVDMEFDHVTLLVGDQEVRALPADAVLRLFNERMTGAFTSAAARRGYRQALDQLQARMLGVTRVFPGYSETSLVFFQPHPDLQEAAELKVYGVRQVEGGPVSPLSFRVSRGG
ncbi:MAG TPA: hypothetical protein VGC81_00580, partial [Candidatus Methylomirabilis sp.]